MIGIGLNRRLAAFDKHVPIYNLPLK
nr:unnamed protein product [Callosobruchus analis]